MVSHHPDPPQLLRARLRLALHSYGGEDLNQLVHHEPGRYSLLIAVVMLLAACGNSHKTTGVFAVKKGMTPAQVRSVAGSPYRVGGRCWLYHATKSGTSIDGMRFCFMHGKVSRTQTSLHG